MRPPIEQRVRIHPVHQPSPGVYQLDTRSARCGDRRFPKKAQTRTRGEPPVGFQKSATAVEHGASRRSLVLVDQAIEDWTAYDPFVAGVGNGVSRLGWTKAAGAVRSAAVVVPNVLGEHHT